MPPTRNQVKNFIERQNIGEGEEGRYNGRNWEIEYHFEPWHSACFSEEELEACKRTIKPTDKALEDEARRKSREIAEEEGWQGFYYFYPDEFAIGEYGGTFFFNAERV